MDDLTQKLNSLKKIKPSTSWKENNRRILLSQISIESEKEIHNGFFAIIHQPAWAVFCILLLVLVGGSVSAHVTKNIKPGNSLFIARIISERAQLAMTFNKEKKARLDMHLAKNRAMEITEIMSTSDFNYQDENKVKKLAQNFKNNINTVKTRLQEINKTSLEEDNEDKIVGLGAISREDSKIFAVESSRNDLGMDFAESNFKLDDIKEENPVIKSTEITEVNTKIETSSPNKVPLEVLITTTTEENINNIIEKVEETFEAKDFEGTKDMLKEVDDIINNIEKDGGEIKGVEEEALKIEANSTST